MEYESRPSRQAAWVVGGFLLGLANVGLLCGCVVYAMPKAGVVRDWPVWWAVLMGPYVVNALCRWSPGGRRPLTVVRVLTALILGCGAVLTGLFVWELGPVVAHWAPPPAISAAAFVGVWFLLLQYIFAAALALARGAELLSRRRS